MNPLVTSSPPTCLWPVSAELGEGPLWVAEQQRLYFVDIKKPALHALNIQSGQRHTWPMPDNLCWLVARRDGDGFMAGLRDRIVRLWLEPALRMETIALTLQRANNGCRMNDAKVDHGGRLWAGSMHDLDYSRADGTLFRLDPDYSLHNVTDGHHICNGPVFSLDGKTMYHTDSYLGRVYASDISEISDIADISAKSEKSAAQTGQLRDWKILWRQFDEASEGAPDGMTLDCEGCLWIAHWGGSRVCRYDAAGTLLATIHLPVSLPTSCTFGGTDFNTLFITTGKATLNAAQQVQQPLAGGLFSVNVAVPGFAAARFG